MKPGKALCLAFCLLLSGAFFSCSHQQKLAYSGSRNRNVCKKLLNKVLVYGIFIETKSTRSWTNNDVKAVSDSAAAALAWLKEKAADNDIALDISFEALKAPDKSNVGEVPANGRGTDAKSTDKFTKWADGAVKKIAPVLPRKNFNDSMPHIAAPKDIEKLVAKLRDEHASESVAVIFFLNMKENEAYSYNVNSESNSDVEFSVTGFNRSGVIAFEILRLFGANSLAKPANELSNKEEKLIKLTGNDIMVRPFTDIGEMEMSDYTKYLIGWKSEPDKKIIDLLSQ